MVCSHTCPEIGISTSKCAKSRCSGSWTPPQSWIVALLSFARCSPTARSKPKGSWRGYRSPTNSSEPSKDVFSVLWKVTDRSFTLPCLHHHRPLTFLEPLYTDSSTTQTNALTGLGYVQMLHKHL